ILAGQAVELVGVELAVSIFVCCAEQLFDQMVEPAAHPVLNSSRLRTPSRSMSHCRTNAWTATWPSGRTDSLSHRRTAEPSESVRATSAGRAIAAKNATATCRRVGGRKSSFACDMRDSLARC